MVPSFVNKLIEVLALGHNRRKAIKALQAMDSHLLRDLGIERHQIFQVVNYGIESLRDSREAELSRDAVWPLPPVSLTRKVPDTAAANGDAADELRAA